VRVLAAGEGSGLGAAGLDSPGGRRRRIGSRRISSSESRALGRDKWPRKEVSAITKVICRPVSTGKPGPKTVKVSQHTRSTPKPIGKKCGK
jgi:hypothetical protein